MEVCDENPAGAHAPSSDLCRSLCLWPPTNGSQTNGGGGPSPFANDADGGVARAQTRPIPGVHHLGSVSGQSTKVGTESIAFQHDRCRPKRRSALAGTPDLRLRSANACDLSK